MGSSLLSSLPNAVVVHSGGPTAVLNAGLAGVSAAWEGQRTAIWGARFGVEGLLGGDLVDLRQVGPCRDLSGSALGSSRRRLSDAERDLVIDEFRRRDIRLMFFTGGNGSMAAALAISRHARAVGYELQVIGIPKTIDNDLHITHHTPGYASTASFFVHAARDSGIDNRSLPGRIAVLETLGRNVGWIAAAAAFARSAADDAPHLIYFPERRVGLDRIAADTEAVFRRLNRAVVVVCEGQLDEAGQPFGADVDHGLATNVGHMIAKGISARLGVRVRADKPGLIGRSTSTFAMVRDREESYRCGGAAVAAAVRGETDVMVALRADGATFTTALESVAGMERALPADWISPAGNDVAPEFLDYLRLLLDSRSARIA